MFFTIALDILIAFYVLRRQRRIRIVPRLLSLRFPIVLGVIGLIDLLGYSANHHVTGGDYAWVLATLVVGALILGAIRAFTVRIWTSNEWVVRQGTWVTMGLWVLSLALHFVSDVGAAHNGAGNFEASSFLLYLAVTYAVQTYVVHAAGPAPVGRPGSRSRAWAADQFRPGPGRRRGVLRHLPRRAGLRAGRAGLRAGRTAEYATVALERPDHH